MSAIERSAALAFEGYPELFGRLNLPAAPENWRPHLEVQTLWVIERDGDLLAFLAGRVVDDRLHIDEVDVHRAYQGQGLGGQLLTHAADWARAHGLAALTVTTFRTIPWNGPFYGRVGFVEWLEPAPDVRAILVKEAEIGLMDRWAMRKDFS